MSRTRKQSCEERRIKKQMKDQRKQSEYGDWSEYSDGVGTIPSAPSKINTIKAISSTGVQLTWDKVSNATGYDVEYTQSIAQSVWIQGLQPKQHLNLS